LINNTILILSARSAYTIVTGEDPLPQPLDFFNDENYDDWMAKEAEAAFVRRLSCSPEVWSIIQGIRYPQVLWNTVETSLDTAGTYVGRQGNLRQFHACRLKEDEQFKAYFPKLSNYDIYLDHTHNAITNRDFCTQLFTSLPSQ